jgi:hypothetical protein
VEEIEVEAHHRLLQRQVLNLQEDTVEDKNEEEEMIFNG